MLVLNSNDVRNNTTDASIERGVGGFAAAACLCGTTMSGDCAASEEFEFRPAAK